MNPRFQTGFPGRYRAGEPLVSSRIARCVAILAAACAVNAASGSGNVIDYTYDAAGNITNIARQGAATLSITGFSPTSGPEGTAVTIYGSAFSTTPANNTVTFNGTAATVTASDSGSIATTVPTGATTGPISVTVGGNTVTSSASFTVTAAGAPTITSFTPTSGASGVSVSVTGTNFSTTSTTVALNGVTASSSVGSTTALTFTVPSAVSSGKITATTSLGTGTSATDFIVPPPGLSVGSIQNWMRISADAGYRNIAITTSGKSALVLFDAVAGTYYSLQLGTFTTSPIGAYVSYVILKPDNTVLMSGQITTSSVPTLHLPVLAMTGTYTLQLTPAGNSLLNTNVRLDTDPAIVVGGPPVSLAQDMPTQSSRYTFTASAGQRIGLGAYSTATTPSGSNATFTVRKSDGTSIASGPCGSPNGQNPQADCGIDIVAPVTGTYTLTVDNNLGVRTSTTFQLTGDASGSLSPDAGQAVALVRVGQSATYTFTASAGDSFGVDVSGASITPVQNNIYVSVLKPDGSQLTSCSASAPANVYCEAGTLAAAGTYTAHVRVAYGMYGTFTLTLKQGPALLTTDAPTPFATSNPSESVRARYVTTAGQNFAVGISNFAYVGSGGNSTVFVYSPTGAQVAYGSCSPSSVGAMCSLLVRNPVAGTYSIALQPAAGVKLSGNIAVSADLTGTLTAGVPQSITVARVGQRLVYTFAGNAGDSTSVKLFSVTTTPANQLLTFEVDDPSGSKVNSGYPGTAYPTMLNLGSLPTTGTYSVVVSGYPWQGVLELDPGTSAALNGSPSSIANTAAGEPIRYTFSGSSGQELDFGISGLAYGTGSGTTALAISPPTGNASTGSCATSNGGTCEKVLTLGATGTYSVMLQPPANATLTGGTMTLSTPVGGTLVINDVPQSVAITRTGQTARYAFSGTAGQLLHLAWTSTVISGGGSGNVSVLKPDGSSFNNAALSNGVSGGLDLAALPSTGTYTVVFDPYNAATMSANVTVSTR